MARISTRLCSFPGCGTVLVDVAGGARCPEHGGRNGWIDYKERGNDKRYNSPAWKRLRASYIRRHPVCERCSNRAEHVHHKDRHPDRFLDERALESLCGRCHRSETARQGGLVRGGKTREG